MQARRGSFPAAPGGDRRPAYRRKVPVRYAPAVRFAVVHHTAGASRLDAGAVGGDRARRSSVYHVYSNGWDDIGYNFLVDRFGQIFEGRYGGIDRPVIGAHAEGFNDGSVGVALIGTYSSASPSAAARAALVRLLAWRLDIAHVDPLSRVTFASGGNPEYRAGRRVTLRAISGHRDTGYTTCPGSRAYALLPSIAAAVAKTGLPKLYSPLVEGKPGGLVHFTGAALGAARVARRRGRRGGHPGRKRVRLGDGDRLDVGRRRRSRRHVPLVDRRAVGAAGVRLVQRRHRRRSRSRRPRRPPSSRPTATATPTRGWSPTASGAHRR